LREFGFALHVAIVRPKCLEVKVGVDAERQIGRVKGTW